MQLQDDLPMLTGLPPAHQTARSSLIALLRGVFACPTIGALAELGVIDRMLGGAFDATSFPEISNQAALVAVLRYLQSLGLLGTVGFGQFEVTEEGRRVLKRSGAFQLLLSYRSYFDQLPDLLRSRAAGVVVDRRQNVAGSGSLHSRKFFSVVWEMFRVRRPGALIDLGCGNGQFASQAFREWPDLVLALVDLSPIAVDAALARPDLPGREATIGIVEAAENVDGWVNSLPTKVLTSTDLVVSMWFVVHEFAGGKTQGVVNFFRSIHARLPQSSLIVGEIVSISPAALAEDHVTSIMPEFLLFHELSGQGVLSWERWQEVLRAIPYELKTQVLFDPVGPSAMPSSFVWHLIPI